MGGFVININLVQQPRSFAFRAFSYSNYIFNFPTRGHDSTDHDPQGTGAERNRTGGLLGIIQRTQMFGAEKEHFATTLCNNIRNSRSLPTSVNML